MLKQRFVEILVDGEWQVRTYAAVKKDMIFRLYDVDGAMYSMPNGETELLAITDAVKNGDSYSIDFISSNSE